MLSDDHEAHPIIVDTLGPQGGAQNVIRSSEADSMSMVERERLMKAQTKAIYVFGKIDYEDAFGVRRCTSYRFMVGGNSGLLGGDMLRMDSGNEANRIARSQIDRLRSRGRNTGEFRPPSSGFFCAHALRDRVCHGQSMTSAQNSAHHTSTGCMSNRGP
jgi:hypothetical protein